MGNFKNELSNYQNVPRALVFDKTLSDRARFVYVFMACKPDGWDFFLEPMSKDIGYSIDTLRKYLNELVASGWLVKGEQSNEHGIFGAVEYTLKANKFTDTEKYRHGKNPTQDNNSLSNTKDTNIKINNINENNKEKEPKEKKRSAIEYTEDFEKAFELTGRKGSKKNAFKRWQSLNDKDKESAMIHIPFYYKSNERRYLKDFEGYLNGRYFDCVVYGKDGRIIYDPEIGKTQTYRPAVGGSLMWNDIEKCYYYIGMFYGHIADGYNNDNRPHGATITLNNGRGTITWNRNSKQWEKV